MDEGYIIKVKPINSINKSKRHDLLINMAIFSEVAAQGSFSATAHALQMTPSSISKRIAKLEDELGIKLIERTTRSMRLTSTGEQFLTHCQNMINEADSAVEVAHQSQDELRGSLSISAPKAFAKMVLEPLVLQFLHTYPHINVQVLSTDEAVDLLREQIDCSIELGSHPSDYLIAKPLIPVRWLLCATPNYLAKTNAYINSPTELKHHSCIYLGETPNDNLWQFTHSTTGEQFSIRVQGRFTCNHSTMRLQAVLQDLGIGCFPDFVVDIQLKTGELVEVLPNWQLQTKYHGMAWITYLPNKFQSLRLRTFIGFLLNNHACEAIQNA